MAELLRAEAVAARIGVSVRTLYRWVAAGKGPRPVKSPVERMRWRRADVERWLERLPIMRW